MDHSFEITTVGGIQYLDCGAPPPYPEIDLRGGWCFKLGFDHRNWTYRTKSDGFRDYDKECFFKLIGDPRLGLKAFKVRAIRTNHEVGVRKCYMQLRRAVQYFLLK